MSIFSAFRSNTDLLERLEAVERKLRSSELDWDELYDKCKRLLGRVAKERANMERTAEAEETPASTETQPSQGNGRLNPRQREIQQAILRRRAGLQ